jgi:hypothetical protein
VVHSESFSYDLWQGIGQISGMMWSSVLEFYWAAMCAVVVGEMPMLSPTASGLSRRSTA